MVLVVVSLSTLQASLMAQRTDPPHELECTDNSNSCTLSLSLSLSPSLSVSLYLSPSLRLSLSLLLSSSHPPPLPSSHLSHPLSMLLPLPHLLFSLSGGEQEADSSGPLAGCAPPGAQNRPPQRTCMTAMYFWTESHTLAEHLMQLEPTRLTSNLTGFEPVFGQKNWYGS